MLSWLKKWLGLSKTYQPQSDEKLLTLEREIQDLRLELAERDQLIDKLKQQLEQQRTSENNNIDSAVQNQIEQLLIALNPSPLTYILKQFSLTSIEYPRAVYRSIESSDRLLYNGNSVFLADDHF